MSNRATDLARSAASEWDALVSTAVVGTDRRMPPTPEPGWQPWAAATDPAVALLDRAAAVVIARRAGARPAAPPQGALPPAPLDGRPWCPPACAVRLQRILGGQHEVLLPEWLERCQRAGVQLPWVSLPTLLLRGRRHSQLDLVVRQMAAGRAEWLADVLPELGVPVRPAAVAPASAGTTDAWGRPPTLTDSGAVVSAMVQVFADGMATWAAAPQLRITAAALDPAWLPALVVGLSRLVFHSATERTRAEVLGLAEFRLGMLREFDAAAPDSTPTAHSTPIPDDGDPR
jgi:hypothetical protein